MYGTGKDTEMQNILAYHKLKKIVEGTVLSDSSPTHDDCNGEGLVWTTETHNKAWYLDLYSIQVLSIVWIPCLSIGLFCQPGLTSS